MTGQQAAKKPLMEIRTMGDRAIITVEPDGSVTYGEPMKPEEFKRAVDYAVEKKLPAAEALMAMLFGSELARLHHENVELRKRLGVSP